jgi:geranylgeranyl diphosphate synthase type I
MSSDVRAVVGYHQGWLDKLGRGSDAATGKALRPALALLGAQAAGGAAASGMPAAVAVELIHDFSLLHDDVMDGDTERRHRPAAWTVFGTSAAILAGDALLATALEVLLEHDSGHALAAARSLTSAVQRLIAGQAADLDFERRDDVTPEEYLSMASGKTAALLSCACSLGALLAGAPPRTVARLARFGNHLGLAFQLVDDVLGIWGDEDSLGKPVLADLRARKKSAPVVAALHSGTPAARRLAELYLRPDPLTENDLVVAARLVEESGGRQWSEQEAARQLALAERCLDDLPMPVAVRVELLATARFVAERRH